MLSVNAPRVLMFHRLPHAALDTARQSTPDDGIQAQALDDFAIVVQHQRVGRPEIAFYSIKCAVCARWLCTKSYQ